MDLLTTARFPALMEHFKSTTDDGRYLHWSELKRRPPPGGLTSEEWWTTQKMARRGSRVEIPLFKDTQGRAFWFCRLDTIDRATHELDRRDAAREMLEAIGDEAARHNYRFEQLIEEAISSSLIEGARLTTRAEAAAMIRDGRKPGTRGEKMVANNYNAMQRLLALADHELTLDDLLEIHATLGADALDCANAEGRLRRPDEPIQVEDELTNEVWFVPPPAEELPERLEQMLRFANGTDSTNFLHPLLRAIVLHFWLAYLHPFVDGNGRMARALFYWQMLRGGYDFAQYLSISGPIDRARSKYYMAFVHTETDESDLTYFLVNQLKVLGQATDELLAHLRTRGARLREIASALSHAEQYNHRQQAVLSHVIRQPHPGVTVNGHARSHAISYLTARKDLQDLEREGLLRRVRQGKLDRYLPAQQLVAKIESKAPGGA